MAGGKRALDAFVNWAPQYAAAAMKLDAPTGTIGDPVTDAFALFLAEVLSLDRSSLLDQSAPDVGRTLIDGRSPGWGGSTCSRQTAPAPDGPCFNNRSVRFLPEEVLARNFLTDRLFQP